MDGVLSNVPAGKEILTKIVTSRQNCQDIDSPEKIIAFKINYFANGIVIAFNI